MRFRFPWRTALAILVTSCLQIPSDARQNAPAPANGNFDIRSNSSQASARLLSRAAAVAGARAAQLAGVARLRQTYPGLTVTPSPELGTPEVIEAAAGAGFLSEPGTDRVATLRSFVGRFGDAYGVSARQTANTLEVAADYVNPSGNIAWVELRQQLNGIPVFEGSIRGAFTGRGELARTVGTLAAGVDASALPTSPTIAAPQAAAIAVDGIGGLAAAAPFAETGRDASGRVMLAPTDPAISSQAWLMYFPLAPGVVRLAWAVQIVGSPQAYVVLVDAEDGTPLFRKNLTSLQTQPASYTIYNADSPAPARRTVLPGSGTQEALVPRQTMIVIGNEAPNTFNTLGWMTDGTNTTAGNNVVAGVDTDGNGLDSTTDGVGRTFDFPYNPGPGAPPPGEEPTSANYLKGVVTNAFYWSNTFHDRLYRLGFTEAAGNFQQDNFGRGGNGGDRISAEIRTTGTNNAVFQSVPDGGTGRMFLFRYSSPDPDRPSGLDRETMIHELAHGLSNRLHGNALGLTRNMAMSMGEGWSDFYAHALEATADEDVGALEPDSPWTSYLLGGLTDNYYYGIRRFPYAIITTRGGPADRPHNPLTFADVDAAQADASDGAYPPSPIVFGDATEVHNAGEIWALALFEIRARFITRLGFPAGNDRILQFVTDGMKLDPVNPTMLQGRDAIVAAARIGGATAADIADIWAGFAARGMGLSAQVLNDGGFSGFNTTVVEAFDVPTIDDASLTIASESIPNGYFDQGERVSLSLCLTNESYTTTGSVTATLAATGGVSGPSAPQAYGALALGDNVCRTFTFAVGATCGREVTAQLQVVEAGGRTELVTKTFLVGTRLPVFSENFDGVTQPALPAGWASTILDGPADSWKTSSVYVFARQSSAPNEAFVKGPAAVSDVALVSPTIHLSRPGRLTFQQHYTLENDPSLQEYYDGGVLEMSVNGGAFQDILDAGGSFVTGGYNATIELPYENPLAGRAAWSDSPDSDDFVPTVVELPTSARGQNVAFRWRLGTDNQIQSYGWVVDGVLLEELECAVAPPPPTTVNDAYSTAFGVVLSVPAGGVLANDTGAGPLSATLVSPPTHGSVTLQTNGAFSYTPAAGYSGLDAFTYTAANGGGPGNVATVSITVAPPVSAQPPSQLQTWSLVGHALVLRWTPPAIGPAPTGYLLEAGFGPGHVTTTIPLDTTPGVALQAPTGTFFLRVRTVAGAQTSEPSNEIRVFVQTPALPSPPADLLGMVNGSSAGLVWRNTFEGGAPTGIVLDVTGSQSATIPLALTDNVWSGDLPAGTFTFRVRATNAVGTSEPSNPITLTFPGGCSGTPQAPTHLVLAKVGNTAYLLWDLPASGAAPSAYVLNVTGGFVGRIPVGSARTFSVAPAPGTYHVNVQSVNACGEGGASSTMTITFP